MPSRTSQKEEDYVIYKIHCCNENIKEVYVGSTYNFAGRKYNHKLASNSETHKSYNLKIYKCIRENGGFDNWTMTPLEQFKATKLQAEIKEEYYKQIHQSQLNSQKAYISPEENQINKSETALKYYYDNIDVARAYSKTYGKNHREAINAKRKEYRKENRDKINAKRREYCKEHREAINAKSKEKYQERKAKMLVKTETNIIITDKAEF